MAQLSVPSAPREYSTQYRALLGVDFRSDQTEVDRRRSPDMVNMISDFGGNPVKRDGYRIVGRNIDHLLTVDSDAYGVGTDDTSLMVQKLEMSDYELNVVETTTLSRDVGTISATFVYQESIYILATKAFIRFKTEDKTFDYVGTQSGMMSTGTVGESAPVFFDNIPDTIIALNPDGTGGATLDDKNIFSIYQRVNYKGDGSTTQYKIPVYGKMGTYVKAEIRDASGEWQAVAASVGAATQMTGKTLDGTGTMTSNVVDTVVTFASAPGAPVVRGEDNVRITFAPYSTEADGSDKRGYYSEKLVSLLQTNAIAFHSGRLFIGEKYRVYYSDVSDPFTVSDLAWFDVDNEIMSFTRASNYLAVITKDNGRSTIFLANEVSRTVDSDTNEKETYFAVKASNAGIGAVSSKCTATLSDEPMFLSNTGLYGLLTNWQSEKYAVNRSSRINRKLCKEPNLENAVGIAWNDYFYLAINRHMYVLDGRHKETDKAGNKPLEAYYFEGMPDIKQMFIIQDRMYFVDDEYTYTWNDDLSDSERYYDNAYRKTVTAVLYQLGDSETEPPEGEWSTVIPEPQEGKFLWYLASYDDYSYETTTDEVTVGDVKLTGRPVYARWCSVFDDDGVPQKLKTLMKKGTMITLVPHYRSGCEITLIKDGDKREYLGSFDSDMQSFEHIDFTRFTFSSNAVAFDEFTRKKIKKYKRLQIQVENNKAEPFGLTQITKTYTFGNYAKR